MKRIEKQTYLQIFGILVFTFGIYIAYSYTASHKPNLESRASADTLNVTVQLYPTEIIRNSGTQFQVSPVLSASDNKIGYVQLAFRYDPAAIKFTGFKEPPQNLKLTELSQPDQQDLDTGLLLLMFGADTASQTQGGSLQLPKMYFEALSVSESTFKVDTTISQIVFENEKQAVLQLTPESIPVQISSGTAGTLTPNPTVLVTQEPSETPPTTN